MHGRGSARAAAEATAGFNAFLLDQQPDVVDGVAALVASSEASLYADDQYSSYGGDVAAPPMAKPFSQSQQEFSGLFFASSTHDFSDVASMPPKTTKPLLLQALEHKHFEVWHGWQWTPAASLDALPRTARVSFNLF